MSTISPAQIHAIKASVDILDLASRYTELRRKARQEFHGPCPCCGGVKRFVVHAAGWWFCRDCHAQRGDAIELVRFAEIATIYVEPAIRHGRTEAGGGLRERREIGARGERGKKEEESGVEKSH